jgi:Meiotically up-regulated gene 113
MFLYVVRASPSGRIKIGVASNPKRRLQALQTGCSEILQMLHAVPTEYAKLLETKLHTLLHCYHEHGEWFSPEALFSLQVKHNTEIRVIFPHTDSSVRIH